MCCLNEGEKSEGIQNADYILPGAIAELKIVEEEGLEKEWQKIVTDVPFN